MSPIGGLADLLGQAQQRQYLREKSMGLSGQRAALGYKPGGLIFPAAACDISAIRTNTNAISIDGILKDVSIREELQAEIDIWLKNTV